MTDVANLINQANEKGIEFFTNKQYELANKLFGQVLKVSPDDETAVQFTGMIQHRMKAYNASLDTFNKLIELNPNNIHAYNNIALVYKDLYDLSSGIKHLKQALAIDPTFIPAHTNIGLLYEADGQYTEAINHFKYANEIKSDVNLLTSISHAYSCINDLDNTYKYLQLALILDPKNAKSHFNLGIYYGLIKDFNSAFKEMEWKWECFTEVDIITQKPRWNGEDINGKRVLVYSEQASGDMIQFMRYVYKLKELGAYTILECSKDLMPIIYDVEVRERCNRKYDFDYYVSVLSMPYYFGVDPVRQNYIKPVKSSLDWSLYKEYKIGVVWAGGPVHTNDRNRSFDCNKLIVINNIPNVKLFSLQKDLFPRFWPYIGTIDLCRGSENLSMVNMQEHLTDFAQTASIINEIDLIISVDTAVAHLAGAMGKQTWLLLPFNPDWRWGISGDTTIWYDSMRIFRQEKAGDWEGVLKNIYLNLSNKTI